MLPGSVPQQVHMSASREAKRGLAALMATVTSLPKVQLSAILSVSAVTSRHSTLHRCQYVTYSPTQPITTHGLSQHTTPVPIMKLPITQDSPPSCHHPQPGPNIVPNTLSSNSPNPCYYARERSIFTPIQSCRCSWFLTWPASTMTMVTQGTVRSLHFHDQ